MVFCAIVCVCVYVCVCVCQALFQRVTHKMDSKQLRTAGEWSSPVELHLTKLSTAV